MAEGLYFNKDHLWVRVEGKEGVIGVTEHAQEELGDILLVDLPALRTEIRQSVSFGQIESAKAVSDLTSPVSGTVIEINENLEDEPELVNEDPLGEGWIIRVELKDVKELDTLLSEEDYTRYLKEEQD
jgi:glycine cleavage system H protein